MKSLTPPVWLLNTVLLCTFNESCMLCIIGAIIEPRGVLRNSFGWSMMSLGMPLPNKKSEAALLKWLQLCSKTW